MYYIFPALCTKCIATKHLTLQTFLKQKLFIVFFEEWDSWWLLLISMKQFIWGFICVEVIHFFWKGGNDFKFVFFAFLQFDLFEFRNVNMHWKNTFLLQDHECLVPTHIKWHVKIYLNSSGLAITYDMVVNGIDRAFHFKY